MCHNQLLVVFVTLSEKAKSYAVSIMFRGLKNSASIMSHLEHIIWYFLHTQLMSGIITWELYLFPGDETGFVVPYHLQGMIVRTIHN